MQDILVDVIQPNATTSTRNNKNSRKRQPSDGSNAATKQHPPDTANTGTTQRNTHNTHTPTRQHTSSPNLLDTGDNDAMDDSSSDSELNRKPPAVTPTRPATDRVTTEQQEDTQDLQENFFATLSPMDVDNIEQDKYTYWDQVLTEQSPTHRRELYTRCQALLQQHQDPTDRATAFEQEIRPWVENILANHDAD